MWGESSSKLLLQVDQEVKFFACFDAISGYHQVWVDKESSKLLNVVPQMGNYHYTVLGQGICSSQDLLNLITDGSTKLDQEFHVLKNIYNFCVYSDTLEGLEKQIEKLIKLCRRINLHRKNLHCLMQ